MKRIFLSLLILISLISTMEAKTPLTLNAGKNQTIMLGEFIVLKGKIKSGKKSQIEYYQWIKKGKVLNNTFGDEILYNDEIYAENDYRPSKIGEHLLRFQAITHNGKVYEDTLLVIVKNNNDNNNLIIDAGSDKTIKLGDFIRLKGNIKKGKTDGNVYSWKENNKLIINTAGDEILTVDYEERENDYRPTTIGKHQLTFHVESENGKVYTDTLMLTVKKKGPIVETKPISRKELIKMINLKQDVTKVNTSKITNMSKLFYHNSDFNQDISGWDTSNVTNMNQMFFHAYKFNQPIGSWDVSKVRNMSQMFSGLFVSYVQRLYTTAFNQDLSNWDVSNVETMHEMFWGCHFNQDITSWNVSKVTSWKNIFTGTSQRGKTVIIRDEKNQPKKFLNDLASEEAGAKEEFYGNYSKPPSDLSKPISRERLEEMISNLQDITKVNTSNITDMSRLFYNQTKFNQDISNWDTSKVTNMKEMFMYAFAFNQAIGNWNVSKVIDMDSMFQGYYYRGRYTKITKHDFNQSLEKWDVSNVQSMRKMFAISKFNQNIINWDVSNVKKWRSIFSSRFRGPSNGHINPAYVPAKLLDLNGGGV